MDAAVDADAGLLPGDLLTQVGQQPLRLQCLIGLLLQPLGPVTQDQTALLDGAGGAGCQEGVNHRQT